MKSLRVAAVLSIAALALAGCAALPAGPTPAELLQKVQGARTRAEHESLAAYYSGVAASARAEAQAHREMARAPAGVGRGDWTRPAHCRAIAAAYDGRASEQEAMAVAQRQLAALARS